MKKPLPPLSEAVTTPILRLSELKNCIIDFSEQKIKSDIKPDKITNLTTVDANGFGWMANYVQDAARNIVLMDVWICNDAFVDVELKSYADAANSTYIELRSNTKNIDVSVKQTIGETTIGVLEVCKIYRVTVYSGNDVNVNYKGLKVTR